MTPTAQTPLRDASPAATGPQSRRAAGGRGRIPGPRPARPPRPVIACWAFGLAAGAVLIGLTGAHHLTGPGGQTAGLAPSTLARYLQAAAPPGASDVRINGVYGSGHAGAWQFVAHLSWRTPSGQLQSATTQLPQQAGTSTPDPSLAGARLADEQRIGWTPAQLQAALAADPSLDSAVLGSLELQTADADSTLTTCTPIGGPVPPVSGAAGDGALGAGQASSCVTQRPDGSRSRFADVLRDSPAGGPLSVQRDGHRITP